MREGLDTNKDDHNVIKKATKTDIRNYNTLVRYKCLDTRKDY